MSTINYALKYTVPFEQLPVGSTKKDEVERTWKVYADRDVAVDDLIYLQSQGCLCSIDKTREPVESDSVDEYDGI
jgi:hypothetical protein